eukprot:scaffold4425_cov168-Amphora_coffeaeformis.AAC.3
MEDAKLRCALCPPTLAGVPRHSVGKVGSHCAMRDSRFSSFATLWGSSDPPSSLEGSRVLGGLEFVQSEQHQLVYGSDGDGIALVTSLAYPSRVASQMIRELYSNLVDKFASEFASAGENGLNRKANKTLSDVCKKYDDLHSLDKISSLRGQVDVVKSCMEDTIAEQLANMDTANSLALKAVDLTADATVLLDSSEKLKQQMAWKN